MEKEILLKLRENLEHALMQVGTLIAEEFSSDDIITKEEQLTIENTLQYQIARDVVNEWLKSDPLSKNVEYLLKWIEERATV
jgi:hypothetical protein